MKQIKDLNLKRVCDISEDQKTIYIRRNDCVTIIRVERVGKLSIESIKDKRA